MLVGLTYNLKKSLPQNSSAFDDTEAEWDDQKTIDALIGALSLNHRVVPIEADQDAFSKLNKTRPDIVFNVAEGEGGPNREAYIPSILEMLKIPYTGSDPTTLGICLDKGRTKQLLKYHGIETPDFVIVENRADADLAEWNYFPAIVKPLWEGSSKGIRDSSLAKTKNEMMSETKRVLDSYGQPALIEKFLPGREFTAAVMGNGKDLKVLPPVEIKFDALPPGANKIYSFEAKWIWDVPSKPLEIFECPARITERLEEEIKAAALGAFRALRCRDWCRIDIRLDEKNRPNVIELNPLPGILPDPEDNSCFPKAARAAGIGYNELINSVLDIAIKRISEEKAFQSAER